MKRKYGDPIQHTVYKDGAKDMSKVIRKFIEREAFEVGTYPGDPVDLVVHVKHLESILEDGK